MAREWRIEYEGALYHVLSRGNEWRNIEDDDDDRRLFIDTLAEMAERFEIDIFRNGNGHEVIKFFFVTQWK